MFRLSRSAKSVCGQKLKKKEEKFEGFRVSLSSWICDFFIYLENEAEGL